ncbi:MAG TPA: SDR family NAD(P)-dependent oxidoreductase [Nocardioides sp.]|nr:SDR family NAD(P)-dependent oxidoreductase [Nocardioides sp.]
MPVAIITGASRGLGRALARELARREWHLVLDARGAEDLGAVQAQLPGGPHHALAGDVTDPTHRASLVAAARALGGASLLVNNASSLGASPLPAFGDLDPATYVDILRVNLVAPMALTAALLPQLRRNGGRVLNISSDAAVEPYETWGGYGSSKAALDHAGRVLAAEEPTLRVYSLDPGDMRTRMHQEAFPGEDISDRPEPETVVPAVLSLLDSDLPSGRYVAGQLVSEAA